MKKEPSSHPRLRFDRFNTLSITGRICLSFLFSLNACTYASMLVCVCVLQNGGAHVCVYMYKCVYEFTRSCMCMCVCVHACVCVCVCVCAYMHMCVYACSCKCVYASLCVWGYVRTRVMQISGRASLFLRRRDCVYTSRIVRLCVDFVYAWIILSQWAMKCSININIPLKPQSVMVLRRFENLWMKH